MGEHNYTEGKKSGKCEGLAEEKNKRDDCTRKWNELSQRLTLGFEVTTKGIRMENS